MKPKLWDGDNAVGEAKERHLQTLDTPYLTASAEGFMARKRGPFSEVTGEKPGTKLVLDGWFSTSDAQFDRLDIYSSPDYRTNFKKRSTIASIEGAFVPGSHLQPDGKGRARADVPISEWEGQSYYYARTFASVKLSLSGRNFNQLFTYQIQSGFSPIELVDLVDYVAYSGYAVSSGRRFVSVGFKHYGDAHNVARTKPYLQWFANVGGSWTNVLNANLPLIDYEDCAYPFICWMSPTTLVSAVAHRPDLGVSFHLSNDFGATWTENFEVVELFPGVVDKDEEPATEDELHVTYPELSWAQIRSLFLSQDEIYNRLRRTSLEIQIGAVSKSSVAVCPTNPYWNGVKWVFAVSLVAIGAVSTVTRSSNFDAPMMPGETNESNFAFRAFSSMCVIGKGAWVVDFARPFYNDGQSLRRVVTFDFGETYTDIPFDDGALLAANWHVLKPFRSEEYEYVILAPGTRETDGGDVRVLLKTTDLISFVEVSKISGPLGVSGVTDLNRVAHVGTPDKPGPITPHAPWTTDDTWAEPPWWAE